MAKEITTISVADPTNKHTLFTVRYDSKGDLVYKINKDFISNEKLSKAKQSLTEIFSD